MFDSISPERLTAVIALCAILSPVLTTVINKIFDYLTAKRKLDYKMACRYDDWISDTFVAYVDAAGCCIADPDVNTERVFGAASMRAMLYAPAELIPKMQLLHDQLLSDNYNYDDAAKTLFEVTNALRAVADIPSVPPQSQKRKYCKQ